MPQNHEVPSVVVEANYDEDITAVAKFSQINEYSDEMEIDLEEEQKIENIKRH